MCGPGASGKARAGANLDAGQVRGPDLQRHPGIESAGEAEVHAEGRARLGRGPQLRIVQPGAGAGDQHPARVGADEGRAADLGRAQLEVEKSKRYPDITLSAGVARDNEAGRNKAQLGVSIPLPLFDRNQGNVYAATMQSYKAQDLYRELQASLTAELLQAVTRFDLAVGAARDYRSAVLPGAAQAYDAARKGFEAGKFGFLEVLDAQRTLSDGNIAYLTVLASVYQASADIDRILGR